VTVTQLRSFLLQLIRKHFVSPYTVYFTDEKRTRPKKPYVTLKLGTVKMSTHPIVQWIDGVIVKSHPSAVKLEINLFSPGVPVKEAGVTLYQNSACDELTGLCLYFENPETEDALLDAAVSLLLEDVVRDISTILDGVEPDYRAMAEFVVDFTQTVSDPRAKKKVGSEGGGEGGTGSEGEYVNATGFFEATEINETED